MPSDDLFPTTRATWLLERIGDAATTEPHASVALREAREHVMRRYYEPLSAYLAATSYRDVDAPAALVAGFFVDRLSDDAYLIAWKSSGLPLRKWLVNGLLFWMRTEVRRRRRTLERELPWSTLLSTSWSASWSASWSPSGLKSGDRALPTADQVAEPDAVFEREWARSIVSDACEIVHERLVTEGASDRWQLFRRHILDGLSYDEVARELACDAREVRNACRVIRTRLEAAIIELVRAEGVRESEIEVEVARIARYFSARDDA